MPEPMHNTYAIFQLKIRVFFFGCLQLICTFSCCVSFLCAFFFGLQFAVLAFRKEDRVLGTNYSA